MIYLLDTNVCIHLLNKKHAIIQQHFLSHSALDIVLCSVVKAELFYGARRSERVEANLALLNAFFAPLQSVHFDDHCAHHHGQIHADLLNRGKPIGPNDTLIAAIARANHLTLVTHNTAEFARVEGLRLADWELP